MWTTGSAAGVEILPDKLVFVGLRKGFQGYTLKQQAVIDNYRELSVTELRNQLRPALQANGFNRTNLIAGLPDEQVSVRLLELPLEVEENLSQVIRFQVDRFEPAEEEKSYYDYVILSRDESQKKLLIQVAMVRQSVLDEYLTLLKEINLYPAAVRFSGIGLHQILALHEDGFPKKEPCIVLSVNQETVETVVIVGPDRFFSDKVMVENGPPTPEHVLEQVYGFLSRLRLSNPMIGRIYVTGELATETCDGLRQHVTDCELLTQRLRLKDKERAARQPELLPAVGLAASSLSKSSGARFNLIPEARRIIGDKSSIIPTVVLLVLVLILGAAAAVRGYWQQKQLLADVQQQIQELRPRVDEVMRLRQEVENRQAEVTELRDMLKGDQKILLVLKDLTERLPDDTYLNNLQIERGQVTLYGFSDAATNLIPTLRASSHVKSVQQRYITRDPVTKKEKFQFDVVLKD